jgi:hypothetical protein
VKLKRCFPVTDVVFEAGCWIQGMFLVTVDPLVSKSGCRLPGATQDDPGDPAGIIQCVSADAFCPR